jgi:hypothetical protein
VNVPLAHVALATHYLDCFLRDQPSPYQAAHFSGGTSLPCSGGTSEDDIKRNVDALADIRDVLRNADPEDKAAIYNGIGLRLTYQPAQQIVRAEVNLDPNDAGVKVRVRGGT